MALKTKTVADLRKLIAGLPDDQEMLLIDNDGTAIEIAGFDPVMVKDTATGKDVLTIEFEREDHDRYFGFDDAGNIDSNEE